jgi:hypothetical protein
MYVPQIKVSKGIQGRGEYRRAGEKEIYVYTSKDCCKQIY